MDNQLVALVGHEHDDFEQVRGAVWSEDEPAVGVVTEVLDRHRVLDGMQHVVVGNAVAPG